MTTKRSDDDPTPAMSGRAAFWRGKPIWTNPRIGKPADQWRQGWVDARADYWARGGGFAHGGIHDEPTANELARLRPDDVPLVPYRTKTRKGSGHRGRLASGWYQ